VTNIHAPRVIRCSLRLGGIAAALLLCGCSGGGNRAASNTPPASSVPPLAPAVQNPSPISAPALVGGTVPVQSTPWSFDGGQGSNLRTAYFSIYTTETDPVMVERLPRFLEAALDRYSTAAGMMKLPMPRQKMETFVMANRPQWQALTVRILGSSARPLTYIERGGFTTGGRSFLYNIGQSDTFAIASHEGWHQFTQITFAEQMPIWLEEGMATLMEGHRWSGQGVLFLPWGNPERYNGLCAAASKRTLLSLEDILTQSPQSLMNRPGNSNEPAVAYYAQVWSLVHFLREGEGGRYRPGLEKLLSDAASGVLSGAVREKFGPRAGMLAQRSGALVFETYFTSVSDAQAQYTKFLGMLTSGQAKGAVAAGTSPVSN